MIENKPLLSITIPTWNRADSLETALNCLCPQVNGFCKDIEIIISDNYSSDNTKQVISSFLDKFPNIRFTVFYQSENTGFYGNFRKCKELARGEYIWLLSDDDYVKENTIEALICFLKSNPEVGIVFLESVWGKGEKNLSFDKPENAADLIQKMNYKLTLISVVIFRNRGIPEELFSRFHGSDFFGFVIFLQCVAGEKLAVLLKGDTLSGNNREHNGFNWFKAFCEDLPKAISYMEELGFNPAISREFKLKVLNELVKGYYLSYKLDGQLNGKYDYWPLKKIQSEIISHYGNLPGFNRVIRPFFWLPASFLRFIRLLKNSVHKK